MSTPTTDESPEITELWENARAKEPEVTSSDDSFHPPVTDDPLWTETAWFSFDVPERGLVGWVYPFFRPNLGLSAAIIHVWDDTGHSVDETLYSSCQWYLPMPDQDLTDLRMANGIQYRTLEPLHRYAVEYRDADFALDFQFEGVHAPRYFGADGQGHFDQMGHVTGSLCLGDKEITIDCLAMRDRSWSVRHDVGPVRVSYDVIAAAPDHLLHTTGVGSQEKILGGYLLRDGVTGRITSGTREVERQGSRPMSARIVAADEFGREVTATGKAVNGLGALMTPRYFVWASLFDWSLDGVPAWGEDQEGWSLDQLRAARASGDYR
ncbi:MAG: hypothetical protein ACRDHO_12185 [Actinomycetota bacterium]